MAAERMVLSLYNKQRANRIMWNALCVSYPSRKLSATIPSIISHLIGAHIELPCGTKPHIAL